MQVRMFQAMTAVGIIATLGAMAGTAGVAGAAAGGDEAADSVNASTPYDLVSSAANTMLRSLDMHRGEYRRDSAKLRELVDRVLLPHFDTQFAARLVLGRHWRAATPPQQQRFVDAFYRSLLNNYGNALLDFTADRLQVLPYRGPPNADYPTINSRVRKNDGSVVQVNYSLRHTDQGWKVWDVVVEGVSYDKSFQEQFAEQVDREGLDAVIDHLQHGETPAAIKRTTGS